MFYTTLIMVCTYRYLLYFCSSQTLDFPEGKVFLRGKLPVDT